MPESTLFDATAPPAQRPWDARLARRLVTPLKDSWATPNHLTTVRLAVGLAAAAAFLPGTYGWVEHRRRCCSSCQTFSTTPTASWRASAARPAASATFTIWPAMPWSPSCCSWRSASGWRPRRWASLLQLPPAVLGLVAGCAVALIFYLRMRIEELVGKAASRQGSLGGFETEDVLYLLPLVTLFNGLTNFLIAAAIGAPCSRSGCHRFRSVYRAASGAAACPRASARWRDGTALTVIRPDADPAVASLEAAWPRSIRIAPLRREFVSQGAFLYLPSFSRRKSPPSSSRRWLRSSRPSTATTCRATSRAAVSAATRIDQLAPFIARVVSLAGAHRLAGDSWRASACRSRLPMTRMPTRCISTRGPAITSVGTTTRLTTPVGAIRFCSGCSINPRAGSTTSCTPGKRARACARLGADPAGRTGLFRRRQAAPPDHAAGRKREARLADVRVCDRSEHAPVVAVDLQLQGCGRLLRFPPGVSPPQEDLRAHDTGG